MTVWNPHVLYFINIFSGLQEEILSKNISQSCTFYNIIHHLYFKHYLIAIIGCTIVFQGHYRVCCVNRLHIKPWHSGADFWRLSAWCPLRLPTQYRICILGMTDIYIYICVHKFLTIWKKKCFDFFLDVKDYSNQKYFFLNS